jgi:hypothetical protein
MSENYQLRVTQCPNLLQLFLRDYDVDLGFEQLARFKLKYEPSSRRVIASGLRIEHRTYQKGSGPLRQCTCVGR